MRSSTPPADAKVARAMELVAPGAFSWYSFGSSPAETGHVLLGLLGFTVIVYVAVPVLKVLGGKDRVSPAAVETATS